ncbi:MAG: hypothetical protein JO154_23485 [Chitinophaga sp.]|uniref:universal stress protein n=1 Tax=Chitinophaga sp. TaxID=1869181 RepID=UPI0025B9AC88|nr:hypothetical protein [Chitinophaga sp.]MBV8255577.1 hypothetical protein [Chitinophaga sp.]
MKRFIAVINPLNFTENGIGAFKYFANAGNSQLSVIALDNQEREALSLYEMVPELYAYTDERVLAEIRASRDFEMNSKMTQLHHLCNEGEVKVDVRRVGNFPDQEIILESRFSDLLLVGSKTSFAMMGDTNPPIFVEEILVKAECPVLIIPDTLFSVKEIIFSYNGTVSSMFAIKAFTQLFPSFCELPVRVVYVGERNIETIPWEHQLKTYLELHYSRVDFQMLRGDPSMEFMKLLMNKNDCLITFGAYGRSRMSRLFHHSDAENILKCTNVPVFITHP